MKIKLKNIGRIFKPVEVEINGITVLTGENGTGKSTVGKMLYCIFHCFYDYEHQIMEQRVSSIFRAVRIFSKNKIAIRREAETIQDRIRELIYLYDQGNEEAVSDVISEITGIEKQDIPEELIERINKALDTTDEEILDTILGRIISKEFGSQLGHVNYNGNFSEVELEIKEERLLFEKLDDDKPHIKKKIALIKEIVYIDDPYILDSMDDYIYDESYSHRIDLISKLQHGEKKDFTAVDDVVINKELEQVYEKLSSICSGNLKSTDDGSVAYMDDTLKEGISLKNISTGMKSFLILKTLLQGGYLERNGIVILDEPETHQHPEWMKIYAELIVLLHKILGINFLISTHSTDFLNFIELYSTKYNIKEKCKYYLLDADEKDKSMSCIDDVTDHIDAIYSKLSKSFLQASEELDVLNESE